MCQELKLAGNKNEIIVMIIKIDKFFNRIAYQHKIEILLPLGPVFIVSLHKALIQNGASFW